MEEFTKNYIQPFIVGLIILLAEYWIIQPLRNRNPESPHQNTVSPDNAESTSVNPVTERYTHTNTAIHKAKENSAAIIIFLIIFAVFGWFVGMWISGNFLGKPIGAILFSLTFGSVIGSVADDMVKNGQTGSLVLTSLLFSIASFLLWGGYTKIRNEGLNIPVIVVFIAGIIASIAFFVSINEVFNASIRKRR